MATKKNSLFFYVSLLFILIVGVAAWLAFRNGPQNRTRTTAQSASVAPAATKQKSPSYTTLDTLTIYAKDIQRDPQKKLPTYCKEDGTPLNGYYHVFYERPLPSTDVGETYIFMSRVGRYTSGIEQGEWDTYPPHDEIMHYSETYKDGLLEGPFIVYDQRSSVYYQTTFRNGNGLWKSFYVNGKLRIGGYYQNGLEQGIWREYNRNGSIKEEITYERGLTSKTHTY